MAISFELLHTDAKSSARCGQLVTEHGTIKTPVFMPVGTAGTVKAIHKKELKEDIKASIFLGNTYHLYMRPGMDTIEHAGGLHRFVNWDGAFLTDSGGYQIFSLNERRKIREDGVVFHSHIDGSKHFFSPENVVDIQRGLGSDIMMALDECPPYPCDYRYAKKSMHLTHKWLEQGISQFEKTVKRYEHEQCFVPICQGSVYDELRAQSLEFIQQYRNPVYAIGGLSVGEPEHDLLRLVELSGRMLPEKSARYLMGVGTPKNILDAVERGIDMFDCVLPSRNARHGIIYTSSGILHIKNAIWKEDISPIDDAIGIETSKQHSKAYLRHLFLSKEILAAQIATLQNLRFYHWLMEEARTQIMKDRYTEWKNEILPVITKKL